MSAAPWKCDKMDQHFGPRTHSRAKSAHFQRVSMCTFSHIGSNWRLIASESTASGPMSSRIASDTGSIFKATGFKMPALCEALTAVEVKYFES